MKLKELNNIYKQSKITLDKPLNTNNLVLFDGYQYLSIPTEGLSETEIKVLSELYNHKNESDWYQYLINNKEIELKNVKNIQMIHFKINLEIELEEELLLSFASYFNNVIDSFYLDKSYGLIIIHPSEVDKTKLLAFLNMLEEDYSTSLTVFIGSSIRVEKAPAVFSEERELLKNSSNLKVNDYLETYLTHYVSSSIHNSHIALNLKEIIDSQEELTTLIKSLWKHQGNQSSVAKEIFVHRNTINYRIDKFKEESLIDLRNTEHLFLCYVLSK